MNLSEIIKSEYNKSISECTNEEIYNTLLTLVKTMAEGKQHKNSKKKLYYISAEFLIGKLLSNNLINLGIYDDIKEELAKNGKDLCEIEEFEKELPGKDKHHQRYKRHDGGTAHNSLPLLICHSVCHGQKDRHCPQRIGQRKERSKTK